MQPTLQAIPLQEYCVRTDNQTNRPAQNHQPSQNRRRTKQKSKITQQHKIVITKADL